MTADLREKVARALCEADGLDWHEQADFMRSASGGDDQQAYLHAASVAIPLVLAEAAALARNQFKTGDLHAAGCTIATAIDNLATSAGEG